VLFRTPIRRPDPLTRQVTLLVDESRVFATCLETVVCLRADDGTTVWRTSERAVAEPASLALADEGRVLVVGSAGRVFGYDAGTGQLRWENDLPGLGFGPISLRVAGGPSTVAAERASYAGSVLTTHIDEE
jgi:outer membrane protein assembly factor BamB